MSSPIDLFTINPDRKRSYLTDKWNPLVCATAGFCMACFINWGLRKPVFSGIQQHVLFTLSGGALGGYIDRKRDDYFAERDAAFRHYIELHPEDFPTTERKKYGDIFDRWVPIR